MKSNFNKLKAGIHHGGTMFTNPVFKASVLVALSGTLYGFLGYLGTNVLKENLSIADMLFWRFLIAGLWMFIFVIPKIQPKTLLSNVFSTHFLFVFLLGALGYAGSSASYFLASQYDGTGIAMVIFFSYPILIAFFSWIYYRNKLTPATIMTLLMMFLGLLLLSNEEKHSFNIVGIFFGVLAAMLYAFYILGSKKISTKALDSNLLTMTVCLGCAFACLLFSFFTHQLKLPTHLYGVISLLALGILATALPIQLMLEGLKHISSMRASIISVLEPLVTLFVGILLLHEKVSHLQMLGAIVLLGSALIIQFQREL